MVTAAMKLKDTCHWKKSYGKPRQSIRKQQHNFATKVHVVKTMVFPVVMYGCESWTIQRAERRRIDGFELWCWRRLESPLDSKEIQPVHSKGDQSWVFFGRNDAEAETPYFGHLMGGVDSLEKTLFLGGTGGQEEKGTTEDEMAGWHH